jgi:hypothetical protein
MKRIALMTLALVVGGAAVETAVQACGDKFLMVGRGARFQRAYASVHPGKLIVFARPSTDAKAAIRDPQLHRALRQAGHAVSVIEDWNLLEQALKTVPVDLVLVDAAEAQRLQTALTASSAAADALYVAFPSNVPAGVVCRLKSTDRPVRFLDEVESVMRARARRAKTS